MGAPVPISIELERGILARIQGHYRMPNGNVFEFRLEDDRIFVVANGRRVPVYPISETQFRLQAPLAFRFSFGQQGEVESMDVRWQEGAWEKTTRLSGETVDAR